MTRIVILLLGIVSVVVAMPGGAGGAREATGGWPRYSALPWRRVHMPPGHAPARGADVVLLYVAATCPHCAGAARYLDSLVPARGRRLLIVSADPDSVMRSWRSRHGLHAALVGDPALAMRRAWQVKLVPQMLTWAPDGTPHRVVGGDLLAMRRAVERAR